MPRAAIEVNQPQAGVGATAKRRSNLAVAAILFFAGGCLAPTDDAPQTAPTPPPLRIVSDYPSVFALDGPISVRFGLEAVDAEQNRDDDDGVQRTVDASSPLDPDLYSISWFVVPDTRISQNLTPIAYGPAMETVFDSVGRWIVWVHVSWWNEKNDDGWDHGVVNIERPVGVEFHWNATIDVPLGRQAPVPVMNLPETVGGGRAKITWRVEGHAVGIETETGAPNGDCDWCHAKMAPGGNVAWELIGYMKKTPTRLE